MSEEPIDSEENYNRFGGNKRTIKYKYNYKYKKKRGPVLDLGNIRPLLNRSKLSTCQFHQMTTKSRSVKMSLPTDEQRLAFELKTIRDLLKVHYNVEITIEFWNAYQTRPKFKAEPLRLYTNEQLREAAINNVPMFQTMNGAELSSPSLMKMCGLRYTAADHSSFKTIISTLPGIVHIPSKQEKFVVGQITFQPKDE